MKRRLITLCMTCLLCLPAFAQRIVEADGNFAEYNRNSVSLVVTTYADNYDNMFESNILSKSMGSKFDVNEISTKSIRLRTSRIIENTNSIKGFRPDAMTARGIVNCLNDEDVGKQIFNYILQRDKEGRFSRVILDQRGKWNATDKDVMESQLTQVDAMGQNGEMLMEKSYVVVIDMKNPTREERKVKDSKGNTVTKVQWKANIAGYVFKITDAHEVAARVLSEMWIYDTDDAATVAAKKNAYDNLDILMSLNAADGVTAYGDELADAVNSGFNSVIEKLVKAIPEWQVAIDCETVKPFITAKIGTKEGVRNGHRYGIYGQVYNAKKGANEFRRKGFVRATEVADNRRVADGKADSTYFYRISGVQPLKGNEILKEKKDAGISISFDYTYNASLAKPNNNKLFGSFSMANVGVDFLMNIKKRGFSQYLTMNFGLDVMSGSKLLEGHNNYGEYAYITGDDGKFLFDKGVMYFNVSIGYMCGVKLYHFLEVQPYLRVGADVFLSPSVSLNKLKELAYIEDFNPKEEMTEDNTKTKGSIYLDPGVRFAFNIYYPVQLYFQVTYSVNIYGLDSYKVINDYLKDCGYGHKNGLGIGGGVRLCF